MHHSSRRHARRPSADRRLISATFQVLEPRRLFSVAPSAQSLLAFANSPSEMFTRTEGTTAGNDPDQGLTELYTPPTHMLQNIGAFLTQPMDGDALDLAQSYLTSRANDLGVSAADIANAIVTDRYTDSSSGMTHIYLRQTLNGLPIVGAEIGIHVMDDGRILSASSSFISGLKGSNNDSDTIPQITSVAALNSAAAAIGVSTRELPIVKSINGVTTLNALSISLDPIPLDIQYYATAGGPKLGWGLVLRPPQHNSDWYNMGVDASSGQVVFATNWNDRASYNVYAIPTEAPNDGARTVVTDPQDPAASPFGWHDTNGVAGAEFTITRGNNVNAYTDTDANDVIDPGSQPDGTASLDFNFPIDLAQAPSTYRPAAVTNLFYWNNVIHDIHYKYGFTEPAGNFQVNNYGNGGSGNDAVLAEAQDGSGTNNANFGTPPDGSSGQMQMYLWNSTSPSRDGDLDASIIIHEYGHGVSNRLTGGPANANALDALQSGGMGEGWGDWWGLMFNQKAADAYATAGFGMATYVRGQAQTGSGLRRYPYSYTTSTDPLTFDAYGTSGTSNIYGSVSRQTEVHATGEIWATTLWDMSVLLMNKYGFDSNLYTGYTGVPGPGSAGNKLALQLVMDGLKLQPANPTFSQARDAILQADLALTGGANQNEIWQAFARRGLGFSFNDGGNSSATTVVAAFDLPSADPIVTKQSPASNKTQVSPTGSMSFTFSESIDPTSFSLGSDVNFVGPGAVNLNATLTGFSFTNANTVLTVSFTPVSALGAYSMTVGPNILAADNGNAMDQDRDATPGEAADSYTGTFNYATLINDNGFGYKAGAWAYENLLLTQGGAGVTSILTSVDDATTVIPMGTNSFRFYNSTYSAGSGSGSVNACDNGFLSFALSGSASVAYSNTDFTSPVAARFAPLWDDWQTQIDSADQVLYRFDDLNGDAVSDRLVVQWNAVHNTSDGAGDTAVTFQAILQLNTGSVPGVMIANYGDIQSDNAGVSNGASASVGIKDTGTPPTGGNRLLVSQDDGSFPWLGDSQAIRIATDWTAPTVTTMDYSYNNDPPELKMEFSENVGPTLTLADITVTNTTTSQVIPPANMSFSYTGGPNNAASILFPGYTNGVPPDGNYTISFNAAGVTDAQWNPLGGQSTFNFFALAGDADRSKAVDTTDFNILAANFSASPRNFALGDFNYDGTVDTTDFNILAANFGDTLPGDSARPAAMTSAVKAPGAAPTSSVFGTRPIGSQDNDLLSDLAPSHDVI